MCRPIPAYLGCHCNGTYDFTCICNIPFMFGTPPRACTIPKTLKYASKTLNAGSLWGSVTPVSLRCNTSMKGLHHNLTPIYDVYEVLRCLEHEKSFTTLPEEKWSNCSVVLLKVSSLRVLDATQALSWSRCCIRCAACARRTRPS